MRVSSLMGWDRVVHREQARVVAMPRGAEPAATALNVRRFLPPHCPPGTFIIFILIQIQAFQPGQSEVVALAVRWTDMTVPDAPNFIMSCVFTTPSKLLIAHTLSPWNADGSPTIRPQHRDPYDAHSPRHVAFRLLNRIGTRKRSLSAAQWLARTFSCRRASPAISRQPAHVSGPMWLATP
jgi:hypothetical protein